MRLSLQALAKDPRLVLRNTPPMTPIFVACDPSFIRFAIEQVIANSLESSVGKTILEISMKANHNLDTVAIRIQDDGPGITTDDLPRVTTRFFTRKTRGRGLGLSTVASGLQKIGGRIQFESQPGLGTCVTLEFPASTQAQPRQMLQPNSKIQPQAFEESAFRDPLLQAAPPRSPERIRLQDVKVSISRLVLYAMPLGSCCSPSIRSISMRSGSINNLICFCQIRIPKCCCKVPNDQAAGYPRSQCSLRTEQNPHQLPS